MREIVCIAHNLRSTHNVGSLLRTCEGLGTQQVILSGYTPYPETSNDARLPHERAKIAKQINKTALGAENSISWQHHSDIRTVLNTLKQDGYVLAALEQTSSSRSLPDFIPPQKLAIVLGREVEGIEAEVLELCDLSLEIPMYGTKESYNVVQAAAMALYHCTFAK